MVHSKKETGPVHCLTVSKSSKCVTPPNLRVKRPVLSGSGPLRTMSNRSFKPLRVVNKTTFLLVSPKRKQLRINQLTPKKVPSLQDRVSKSLSSSNHLNSPAVPLHHASFNIEFDGDCGFNSSPDTHGFTDDKLNSSSAKEDSISNLAASIKHIENNQKIYIPLYLELLQWNPASFAQITSRNKNLSYQSPFVTNATSGNFRQLSLSKAV